MTTALTWLHLSDLHMYRHRDGYDADAVVRALTKSISSTAADHNLTPDFFFFTGDLAWGHDADEQGRRLSDQFADAKKFLDDVCASFDPPIPRERVFIVPGNHDVKRPGFPGGLFTWLDNHLCKAEPDFDKLGAMMRTADDNWKSFMVRLQEYTRFLELANLPHLLKDRTRGIYGHKVAIRNGPVIGLAGLNSAWCSSRPDFAVSTQENGRLSLCGDWQIKHLESEVQAADVKIAWMHHPTTWLTPIERQEANKLLSNRFHFLLHGHEHTQWVERIGDEHSGLVHHRIAAGYCYGGAKDGTGGYNFVRLDLEQGHGEAILRKLRRDTAEWIPDTGGGADKKGVRRLTGTPLLKRATRGGGRRRGNAIAEPPAAHALKLSQPPRELAGTSKYTIHGFLVVSDLHGFSGLDPVAQRAAVSKLWQCHTEDDLFKTPVDAISNPLGNSVVAAFTNLAVQRQVSPAQVIAFACRVLQRMKNTPPSFQIRVGIHCGAYSILSRGSSKVVFGTTLNECRRIASFGDAGHVLCSERFVELWQSNDRLSAEFEPPLGTQPIQIHKRRFASLPVRMYLGCSASRLPPARYQMLAVLDRRILDALKDLEETLLSGLVTIPQLKDITKESLGARISLFAPQRIERGRLLCPTPYRYHFEGRHVLPGRTRYSLEGKGAGPAGQAFVTKSCVVSSDLPDWQQDEESRAAYLGAMAQFGVDEGTVRAWSRHARSILCFPIGFFDYSVLLSGMPQQGPVLEPDAVVCADVMHALSGIPGAELIRVLQSVKRETERHLAILWRLRLAS